MDVYVVKSGDTVDEIARASKTSADQKGLLYVGRFSRKKGVKRYFDTH